MSRKISNNAIWVGGLLGLLSVLFGAFAAHGLKQILDEHFLKIFQTGVTYQFYHALALLGVGLCSLITKGSNKLLNLAFLFFVAGVCLFSGALYALALTQLGKFGMIAPIGGISLMIGWFCLFGFGVQLSKKQSEA